MHLYLQFQSNSKFPIRSSDIRRGVSVCRVPSLYLCCLFAVAQSIVETENGNACGFTLLRHATYANFTPAKAQALRNKFRCEKAKRKISKLLLRVAKTLRWISQKISLCMPWMAYNLCVGVCRLCVCAGGGRGSWPSRLHNYANVLFFGIWKCCLLVGAAANAAQFSQSKRICIIIQSTLPPPMRVC